MKPLTAGGEIDSWCTKCRMDLGHRIVALVQGAPKRVECQTCGSQHNYRAPRVVKSAAGVIVRGRSDAKPARAPSAGARVALKVKTENERYEKWAQRTLGQSVDAFTRYAIDQSFAEGQLVIHKKFGEGYVDKVLDVGKVSIMFRDGPKTLAQRGQ